jgi:predicted phage baseplate assembly protein
VPLPTPILDDRSYQQLRDELVRRIPVYNSDWTDHNASDPGITLIELFAFLGENLLFRFNQIPEATRLAFLKLLSIPLRPAAASSALVAATTNDPAGSLVPLSSSASAGAVPFETTVEVLAWPVTFVAVSKKRTDNPQPGDEQDFTAAAIDAAQLTAGETPAYYRNQLVSTDPSQPGTLPVDFGQSVDGIVWIAVVGVPGVTLVSKMADHSLNLGFIPDQQVTSLSDVTAPCPGEGSSIPSPETVWEISTGVINKTTGTPQYQPLTVDGDTTRGLSQDGVVRLHIPKDPTAIGVFNISDPDLAGTRDFPPQLDDANVAANILFWIRAYRRSGNAPFGRVLWIGANATHVVQTRKAGPEFLGIGTGEASQVVKLVHTPVIEGSLVVEVEENGSFSPWTAVDGFEASTESDLHYVLDPEAGTVTFGNGVRGRAPQIGQRIRATIYRYGGDVAGNVAAKAINRLDDIPSLKLANPVAANGGAPSESVQDGLDRIPGELRRRDRAVTRGDFEELALATPGGGVGRADTLPLFDPVSKHLDPKTGLPDAAGVVSVVIWPRHDYQHPNAPMPDKTLLSRVCAWLDARRLITTELWIIPPTYVKVAVAIGVQVAPGFGIEAVRRWVELVVRQYLAPLPPYGADGNGWPLGRTVIGRELEAAALQVEGVQFLTNDVQLARWDPASNTWLQITQPTSTASGIVLPNTVPLNPWEVPELAEITVVDGPPLAPGTAITPPANPAVPVPIPTIKEQC